MLSETVKQKCVKFFAVIIKIVKERRSEEIAANVKKLIQDLIDGTLSPEVFTAKLEKELTSAPKPHLIPFLKKGLPRLRHSLITKEVIIEGVNPPPPTAPMLPIYTPPLNQKKQIQPFMPCPVSTTANSSSLKVLTTQLSRPTEDGQEFMAQLIMSIKREITENPSSRFPMLTISQVLAGNVSDVFQIKTEKLPKNSRNRSILSRPFTVTANSSAGKVLIAQPSQPKNANGQFQFGNSHSVTTCVNSSLRSILPAPSPQLAIMPLRDQNTNAPKIHSSVLNRSLLKIPAVLSSELPKPIISISPSVQHIKPEFLALTEPVAETKTSTSDLTETKVTPVASISSLTESVVESIASTAKEKVFSTTTTVHNSECSCQKRKRPTESPQTIDDKIVEMHDYLKTLKKSEDSTMLFLKSLWKHLKQLPEEEENRKRIKIMQCLFD